MARISGGEIAAKQLKIEGIDAWALRFEGEKYDPAFLELIAPDRLRDLVSGPQVTIARSSTG